MAIEISFVKSEILKNVFGKILQNIIEDSDIIGGLKQTRWKYIHTLRLRFFLIMKAL